MYVLPIDKTTMCLAHHHLNDHHQQQHLGLDSTNTTHVYICIGSVSNGLHVRLLVHIWFHIKCNATHFKGLTGKE